MSTPVRASTQEHLDIEDVHDDIVLLKDGGACLVIRTTAVNFGLLSEQEQDAMIYAFAGLLNSLTFPIQIMIRSKRLDISSYIDRLKEAELRQENPQFKQQIARYREFVTATIQENNVLDKRFYIVIPFSSVELGVRSGFSLFGRKRLPYSKTYILEKAKATLLPRRDQILRQLTRLGLKGEQLTTEQLVALYYDIYNPETPYARQVGEGITGQTTPLVRPAIESAARPIRVAANASAQQAPPQDRTQNQPQQSQVHQTLARLDAAIQKVKGGKS